MQQLANKETVLLLRQTVKCIDRLLMDHGSRTAYILYKMLQTDGSYEPYEIADYVVLAMLHDIGAYGTEEPGDMLRCESRSYMPHSVYGYVMLRGLSPFKEQAEMILYHHMNCDKYHKMKYEDKKIAACLFLADRVDIYQLALGISFDMQSLRQYEGVRYTKEALNLLEKAEEQTGLLKKLQDKSYENELNEILDSLVITNEDEEAYIEMILFCMGFKGRRFGEEASMCRKICDMIAQKMYLTQKQREKLKYASLVHDMGMLMIPQKLIEASGKLNRNEIQQIITHVQTLKSKLKGILPEEILEIAMAHHERGNGSGYPGGLKVKEMNLLQRILQVADVVTAMSSKRSYRDERTETQIQHILQEGVANNAFSGEVVTVFLRNEHEIMRQARAEREVTRKRQIKVEKEYQRIRENYI